MAIYHMSVKIISRSTGRSSVGASAYRSGEKIINEYDGVVHDYTRKTGVVHSEIMLCENAPNEWKNRDVLWNEVERIEKSSKAQVAREIEVALPKEFTREEQIQIVQKYVKENFVDQGMCADINIHDKGTGNPHAHIMLTMRSINDQGEWESKQKKIYMLDQDGNKIYDTKKKTYRCTTEKTNNWDNQDNVAKWRESWAKECNGVLKNKGVDERVDHRSYKEQGIDKIPSIHLGTTSHQMEQRGRHSQRGNINRGIKIDNKRIEIVNRDLVAYEQEKQKVLLIIRKEQSEVKAQEPVELTALQREQIASQMRDSTENYARLSRQENKLRRELEQDKEAYREANQGLSSLQEQSSLIKDYIKRIKELEKEKEGLGFFKGKQRKEIEAKIDEIKEHKQQALVEWEFTSYKELKNVTEDRVFKVSHLEGEVNRLERELYTIQNLKKEAQEMYMATEKTALKHGITREDIFKQGTIKDETQEEQQEVIGVAQKLSMIRQRQESTRNQESKKAPQRKQDHDRGR